MMRGSSLKVLFFGFLWCFAFLPWGFPLLQILSLAGVLFVLQTQAAPISWRLAFKQGARTGWCYGLAQFLAGIHWLYISLHDVAQMPVVIAAVAVFGLSAYLALFPSLVFAFWAVVRWWLRTQLRGTTYFLAGVFASAWTLAEYLRAVVFTGFPWLTTGDAWIDTPLSGLYPVLGTYGVSFLVAYTAACFAIFIANCVTGWGGFCSSSLHSGGSLLKRMMQYRQVPCRGRLVASLCWYGLTGVFLSLVLYFGLQSLQTSSWFTSPLQTVEVQLVQPNVSQLLKFDPDHIQNNVSTSLFLGEQAVASAGVGQWLVFPETALPVVWQEAPFVWRQAFLALAQIKQIPVILGAAFEDQGVYTNSVLLLDSQSPFQSDQSSSVVARYDKRHLVPFGEFIPFGFQWFVRFMNIPLGEFAQGHGAVKPFDLNGVHVLPNICYEDTFSHEIAELVRLAVVEPHVLLNLSNLAWFGQSAALEQHAQMSRVRAAELRKPMLRATNTGVSGAIDAWGRWTQRLPEYRALSGPVKVQTRKGLTPYARYGLLGVCVLSVLMCLLGFVRFAVRRSHQVQ